MGEPKANLNLGFYSMIGYRTPQSELVHAWHFKTPKEWLSGQHPLDLFYNVSEDLEVTRLEDGRVYTGDLVSDYGNYGAGCECGKGSGSWGRICLRKADAAVGCHFADTSDRRVPQEIDFPYFMAYGRSSGGGALCGLSAGNHNQHYDACHTPGRARDKAVFVIFTSQ